MFGEEFVSVNVHDLINPPSFDNAVKNIALESEKSKYNPETDMNWCNLPMEMRAECVKRMDFKERCRFRRTSQTEKSLVEAKKYQFENLKIVQDDNFEWKVIAQKRSERLWSYEVFVFRKNAPDYKCIAAILKYAEVKKFRLLIQCEYEQEVSPLLEHMAKFAPFGFKRISIINNASTAFFMENCPNLKKVGFCGKYNPFPFSKILEAPSLMDVKEFKFAEVCSEDFLEFLKGLVQNWIDNDAEVGKSMQFDMQNISTAAKAISIFAGKFSDRVIEKTDKEVRIRMNNETTQILMRQLGIKPDEDLDSRLVSEYCSCKVIPIDLSNSQYGNGDEWIQAAYEKLEQENEFFLEDQDIWGDEFWEEDSHDD